MKHFLIVFSLLINTCFFVSCKEDEEPEPYYDVVGVWFSSNNYYVGTSEKNKQMQWSHTTERWYFSLKEDNTIRWVKYQPYTPSIEYIDGTYTTDNKTKISVDFGDGEKEYKIIDEGCISRYGHIDGYKNDAYIELSLQNVEYYEMLEDEIVNSGLITIPESKLKTAEKNVIGYFVCNSTPRGLHFCEDKTFEANGFALDTVMTASINGSYILELDKEGTDYLFLYNNNTIYRKCEIVFKYNGFNLTDAEDPTCFYGFFERTTKQIFNHY